MMGLIEMIMENQKEESMMIELSEMNMDNRFEEKMMIELSGMNMDNQLVLQKECQKKKQLIISSLNNKYLKIY